MNVIAASVPVITFLLMLAVGLALTPTDFARVRGRFRLVLAGLLGPVILLPPIAIAVNYVWTPSSHVRFGLLLIAISPIGGISNTYSYLAKAAPALSVTLTALSCLSAVVTIPLLARVFELALRQSFRFGVPVTSLLGQVLLMLAAPVAIGMTLRWKAPEFARRNEGRFRTIALLVSLVLLGAIVAQETAQFRADFTEIAAVAAMLVTASSAIGLLVGRVFGGDRRECFTLAVEFGTRNTPVATAIGVTMLQQMHVAVFATAYLLVEIPLMALAVLIFRLWTSRNEVALVQPEPEV